MANWKSVQQTEGWNAPQLISSDINSSKAGMLTMKPSTSSWYEDHMGSFLYQDVNADFVLSTAVSFSGNAGSAPAANSHYSLGGLMVRAPKSFTNGAAGWSAGNENYISVTVGYGDPTGPCSPGNNTHICVNSTVNSVTNLCLTAISGSSVQLRIARIGSAIIVLYKSDTGNWTVLYRESRQFFPNSLQAGFTAVTDFDKALTYTAVYANAHTLNANLSPDLTNNFNLGFHPDLTVGFDYAKWNAPAVPLTLSGVDLVNTATDAQLLSFLTFDVNNTGGNNGGGSTNGIQQVSQHSFYLYPQASNQAISVFANAGAEGKQIIVRNALGEVVIQQLCEGQETHLPIDQLPCGMYFMSLSGTTQRFIKN